MALALSQRYADTETVATPTAVRSSAYHRAVLALRAAIEAIANDDSAGRRRAVHSATEAVTTLYLDVDAKRGGAMAEGLGELYGRIAGRLMRIDLLNDPRLAEQAIDLLTPLAEAPTAPRQPAALPAPNSRPARNGRAARRTA